MSDLDSALRVSHLTLCPSNTVTQSVTGHFAQTKSPELLCLKGNGQWLHLYALIDSSLHSIARANVFGEIRTLNRLPSFYPSQHTDFIAVTTTAGKLLILQYDARSQSQNATHCFRILSEYDLSGNGCVPEAVGQYCHCIPSQRQKDEFIIFLSAPFQRHLFLSLNSLVIVHQSQMTLLSPPSPSNQSINCIAPYFYESVGGPQSVAMVNTFTGPDWDSEWRQTA